VSRAFQTGQMSLNITSIPPVTTGKDGTYCFDNLPAGRYTVSEVNQTGVAATAPPVSGDLPSVTLAAGQNIYDQDFGNHFDPCTDGNEGLVAAGYWKRTVKCGHWL